MKKESYQMRAERYKNKYRSNAKCIHRCIQCKKEEVPQAGRCQRCQEQK